MSSVADIDTKNETHEEGGNEGGGEEASPALNVINNIINPGGEDNIKGEEEDHAPNSLPRTVDADTYTYRDFAAIPAPQVGAAFHPPTLQAQKLPAKLASMLADPELASVIMWSPHGRSWRVLNRDEFAEQALPRYFGHTNYASFVRIVNAWGFRRITRGPDRDSYYHELFLRGRTDLHLRMKRLSSCHRKTPIHKEDKCPDFYELAKVNPLPDNANPGGGRPNMMMPNMALNLAQANQFSPLRMGMGLPHALPAMGNMAHLAGMGMNEHVLSMMMQNGSGGGVPPGAINNQGAQPSLPHLVQLQMDNETLRRRIMEMEQAQGGTCVEEATTTATTGANDALQQELNRMQRDFMMHSNNGMNNQYVHFGGGNEMLVHAMQSQMGHPQQAAAQEGGQPQEKQKEHQEQQQEQQEQQQLPEQMTV